MKEIYFSEIYEHIKNGTLEEYLNKDNNRMDIHLNGTRPIATWTKDFNTSDEKMVDICLDIDGEGKPKYFERLQFDDGELTVFNNFSDALNQMLIDIEKQINNEYEF
jgi:hypothetical protein